MVDLIPIAPKKPTHLTVVRVIESYFMRGRSMVAAREVRIMRRLSTRDFHLIEEDIASTSLEDVLSRIVNLPTVEPGLYTVGTVNEQYGFEEGHRTDYLEEWDYELYPYEAKTD